MKDELVNVFKEIIEEHNENKIVTEEEKIRVAYALNMCMVSVSQIIDYDDLYILEQEYDGILNNLNLEMMPKDEALLSILKQLLDTITFFKLQEGDKNLLDETYQQKMKNAMWSAMPNPAIIIASGDPVIMAVSLASQVGIGYMNYRRAKAENDLEYKSHQWKLQRSAMEQFNGLRRELFDTAWRLATAYQFPDEYRLTERQIKQYDEILMDSDEIRKYERLTTIKSSFKAYPPFWYHYGSTANHIARNQCLSLSDESRNYYKQEAVKCFEEYWNQNKYALLREDIIASSCALEYIDLLDTESNREKIKELLDQAVKYSGNANDVLQLCAVGYLKINDRKKASDIFRILVNEEYNIVVNAQILSGLYVHNVLESNDCASRNLYETLTTRVKTGYLFRMPSVEEHITEIQLKNEFDECQEELLQAKFKAVIGFYFDKLSIRLGKLIPVPDAQKEYPEYYFSEEGAEKRSKDIREMFSSSYKQKRRMEYLNRLSQCDLIHTYFEELNKFFSEITELNCIRDRQKLRVIIRDDIVENADYINQLSNRIEEKKVTQDDLLLLLKMTSLEAFESFITELISQINTTIIGMNEMSRFAMADTKLRDFCMDHNIPEPDELLEKGSDAKSDTGFVNNYFGMDLLEIRDNMSETETERFQSIEQILKKYAMRIANISPKATLYFHDSEDFNTYFENSKLKNHKDILQKTIAVYDDKGIQNIDVLFTVNGVVPVIKNVIKTPIPYISLANELNKQENEKMDVVKNSVDNKNSGRKGNWGRFPDLIKPSIRGIVATEIRPINHICCRIKDMIDEVCDALS